MIRGKKDPSGVRTSEPTAMKPEISKTDDGEIDGRHVAMQDFMAAHQEGSAEKMCKALSNYLDVHNGMGPSPESADGR